MALTLRSRTSMDVMLRDKAEELAKEIAVSISTQQELSDVMRLMTNR